MPTWDATNPANSDYLVSSEIRQNWESIAYAIGSVNLIADPTFLIWPSETVNTLSTSGLAHYTVSGAGAQYRRSGTGLTATTRKVGKYCVQLTAGGGATGSLTQQLLTTTSYDDVFDLETFSAGCYVWCASSSAARISLYDGAGTVYSSYHTGNSTWQWLTLTKTIEAAADRLAFNMEAASGVTAYFSGPTVIMGPIPPSTFKPSPVIYGSLYFQMTGTCTTGTQKATFSPSRPFIVKDTLLHAKTAPTGAAVIVDVNHWDGSAFQTMYATRPQIAASATIGSAQPDGTYRYRCFTGVHSSATDGLIDFDVDQVGSTVAGVDVSVHIRCLQFARPLEAFLGHNEVA